MPDIGPAPAKLEIGAVIKGAVAVGRREAATVGLLALLLIGVPSVLQALGQAGAGAGEPSLLGVLGGLLMLFSFPIFQGGAILSGLEGRKVGLAEGFSAGLSRIWPLLAITILAAIGLVLGLIALVIPFFWLITAWCVVMPVRVAEPVGIEGAFRRSMALSRGNRWRILGLIAVLLLITWAIDFVFMLAVALLGPLIVVPFMTAANAGISVAVITMLYVELKRLHEGGAATLPSPGIVQPV